MTDFFTLFKYCIKIDYQKTKVTLKMKMTEYCDNLKLLVTFKIWLIKYGLLNMAMYLIQYGLLNLAIKIDYQKTKVTLKMKMTEYCDNLKLLVTFKIWLIKYGLLNMAMYLIQYG